LIGSQFKVILQQLRNNTDPSIALLALQELSEMLCVSTEETLSLNIVFPLKAFVSELVHLLKYGYASSNSSVVNPEEVLQHTSSFEYENPEVMLLACRCLCYIMEALPSSVSFIADYKGTIKTLCEKLLEVSFIDLAEQALSVIPQLHFPDKILICYRLSKGYLGSTLWLL
jgi:E3 ubiquitin-protein ligase TRIP12